MTVSFTMDPLEDRRLIHWLESLPKGEKSKAIREALNAYLGGVGLSLGDVYQAVKELERTIEQRGVTLVQTGGLDSAVQQVIANEPQDIAANLDSLGL